MDAVKIKKVDSLSFGTVHFDANDRPIMFKTVHFHATDHFEDGPIKPLWTAYLEPDSLKLTLISNHFSIFVKAYLVVKL